MEFILIITIFNLATKDLSVTTSYFQDWNACVFVAQNWKKQTDIQMKENVLTNLVVDVKCAPTKMVAPPPSGNPDVI